VNTLYQSRYLGAASLAVSLALPLFAMAAPVTGVMERPATISNLAQRSVMLALAHAGKRTVAVGERGLILLSDDDGKTWRQAQVPVSTTLTAVAFPTPLQGWAVGHAGIVLHTIDGGTSWVKQLDGRVVAQLVAEAAKASANPAQLAVAQQLVADGPDKPFLDLHFDDASNGIVVGAYGLVLRTADGGNSWQPLMARVDNPKGLHLYAVTTSADTIYLAGEQGFLVRSDDAGKTFVRLSPPYSGSFFTVAALASGDIIIGGLKGNAFRSSDRGASFQRSAGFAPISLSASTVTDDDTIVFANQAGQVYVSSDKGRTVRPVAQAQSLMPISALLPSADGQVIAAGLRGLTRLSLRSTGGAQ
jgi:photosystem II stability/assembly factor-like uncharacterized protein